MSPVARIAFLLFMACAIPAQAQTAAPVLAIELNALQASETGCRITFVVTNNLGSTLDLATTEIALFNTGGAIERIIKLDFKALIDGKSKVLQFNIPDLKCESVGRLLLNDITACQGDALEPAACLTQLKTTAIPDVAFGV